MADPTATSAPATPDRPWLGLAHFTAADRDYFYGRENEIRDLSDRVRRTPLVILYGVSGYGKSSLLGAGLVPALDEAGFTVTLMRRCYESLPERSLVADVIAEVSAAHPGIQPGPDGNGGTLWEFFHDLTQPWFQSPGSDGKPPSKPVLILDQFEEIFTRGQDRETLDKEADGRAREHARDFLEQLADLVENRPPAALRTLLESGTSDQRRGILSRYDFDARPVRCVLTLRDDFLAHLERWRRAMPSMMEHRVELQLLSGPQAFEAVFKPGTKRPAQAAIIPREAAEAIVRTVAQVDPGIPLSEIQAVPSLLSLLCEQLNLTRLADDEPAPQVECADVEDHSSHILQRFYEESFTPIPDPYREMVRAYVEDEMIAADSGHRHPVAREAAENHLKKNGVPDPAAVFDELIVRRLLSAEEQRGSTLLEITHDVLVSLIIDSRNERQERCRKEQQERELAAERQKVAAEARKARQRLWIAITMSALMVAAVAGAVFGLLKREEALRQRDDALYNEGIAWMFRAEVAEEQGNQYPGALLYAATAIGFDGAGRGKDAEKPVRYITPERDKIRYGEAVEWLKKRSSYLPVWSSATGGPPLDALAFSPSGRSLAAGGQDGQAILWDLSAKDSATRIPSGSAAISDLAFQPDGARLAVAATGGVSLWEIASAKFSGQPLAAASAVAYSPDGKILLAAAAGGELMAHTEGREPLVLPGFKTPATRIAFSANNSVAAAAVPGSGVLVCFPWSGALSNAWAGGMKDVSRPLGNVTALALSPDGSRLAIGNAQGSISVWDVADARWLAEISTGQRHRAAIRDLCYRHDGQQLASASDDGQIKLWNVDPANPTPDITATLTGHKNAVTRICYAPGGGLLASCGADGSAKLWNVSRDIANHSDLYRYISEGWYLLGLDTKSPAWGGKSGFIALPETSLIGLWQQPSPLPRIVTFLSSSREWQAAASALAILPEAPRKAAAAKLTTELAKDAAEATAASRWKIVDLRLSQWDQIGAPDSEILSDLRLRRASLGKEGAPFINSENIPLIWCPAGTFTMGSPDENAALKTRKEEGRREEGEVQHQVTLTRGFWIGKFEVTQEEWLAVIGGDNPARYKREGLRQPVECIKWSQAMDFCRKLTDRERSRGILPPGWEYSLPTEAEWEYACRAGSPGPYCFGDDRSKLHLYGNFKDLSYSKVFPLKPDEPCDISQDDGKEVTTTVGKYLPNIWGIHDMHGNVLEWCRDQFQVNAQKHVLPGETVHLIDPLSIATKPEEKDREARGGSWHEHSIDCRSARGFSRDISSSSPEIGMRVALVRVRPEK